MSKTTLKKQLNELTREQLIEVMLELYEARKDAREYLEYRPTPSSTGNHPCDSDSRHHPGAPKRHRPLHLSPILTLPSGMDNG